jgi:DNA-binding transcriptional LysR family regulator
MINPTLNQLKAFRSIVRLGTFQAAAVELRLSQPSISQRVKELEAELGTVLFVRRGPRISLTSEGHALIGYADRMLATAGEMTERFRTRDPLKGTLRIGLSENFALICLGELFRRVEQRYPDIRASMFIGDSGALSQKLNERELDIAIVAEPQVQPHVTQEPVGCSRLGWFAQPDFFQGRDVLSPADLTQYHLMISPPSSRLHGTIGRWFAEAGVTPSRVSTCNNVTVTILTVLSGTAIGLLPVRIVRDEVAAGRMRLLRVTPDIPAHRVSICYQTSEVGEGLLAFVTLLKDLIADHQVFAALPAAPSVPAAPAARETAG